MNNNTVPLNITLETAKSKLISAFNGIIAESEIPAYLAEGMVLELLAEVRNRKNLELTTAYKIMQTNQVDKIKREGKR